MQLNLIYFVFVLFFVSISNVDSIQYEKNCHYRRKFFITKSVAVTKNIRTTTLHREYVPCGNLLEFFRCLRVTRVYKIKQVTTYKLVREQQFKWVPCCCRGERRDRESDLCEPICTSPCQNNGICIRPGKCSCTPKWEGLTCETDVNECRHSPCAHICTDLVPGYTCSCRLGYQVDPSNRSQCIPHTVNVQTFQVQAESLTQTRISWKLEASFALSNLLTAIKIHFNTGNSTATLAKVNPSINTLTIMGLEVNRVYAFRIELLFHASIPVKDQVIATGIQRIKFHTPSILTSQCLDYHNKHQKELATSQVTYREDPNPCYNGGYCIDDENPPEFTCKCSPGFVGDLCNELNDPCLNSSCENGGVCIATSDRSNYTCRCPPFYMGVNCEVRLSVCDLYPQACMNGAHCIESTLKSTGYECVCATGYIGRHCEVAYNYCGDRICLNNGVCQHNVSSESYHCACSLPYYGERCEITMKSCATDPTLFVDPCQNDGLCYKYPAPVNESFCACPKHAMGEFCEETCTNESGEMCQCDVNGGCATNLSSTTDVG